MEDSGGTDEIARLGVETEKNAEKRVKETVTEDAIRQQSGYPNLERR
jgi:hypothetical protein